MEWINFRHLHAFWAVCRHGGFARAASRIHVSQSTVSEQVAQLESYLEEQLLIRTTRSVRVTERGAELLKVADEIFTRSAEINQVFRDKSGSSAPTKMRIGMVGGVSRNFIFGLLLATLVEERGIAIDVVDGSLDQLTGLLKTHELDLIFGLERPRHKDLLTLQSKRVEQSPLCLAGTPDLIRRVKRRRKTPAEVEIYAFRHPVQGKDPIAVAAERYMLDPTVPITTDDISLLRFLANSGRGLALMPEIGMKEDLGAGSLSRIRLDDAPVVELFAIFLKGGAHRELIDDFLA